MSSSSSHCQLATKREDSMEVGVRGDKMKKCRKEKEGRREGRKTLGASRGDVNYHVDKNPGSC